MRIQSLPQRTRPSQTPAFPKKSTSAKADGRQRCGLAIGRTALEMNYAFAPAFQELSQSTEAGAAYIGQATLTRLPIRSARILPFKHHSGVLKPHIQSGRCFSATWP